MGNSSGVTAYTVPPCTVIAKDLSFPEGVAYRADGIAVVAETGT